MYWHLQKWKYIEDDRKQHALVEPKLEASVEKLTLVLGTFVHLNARGVSISTDKAHEPQSRTRA